MSTSCPHHPTISRWPRPPHGGRDPAAFGRGEGLVPLRTHTHTHTPYLQLPVVLPDGLQEAVILPSLVCFEAQISLQRLLLALQALRPQTNRRSFVCSHRTYKTTEDGEGHGKVPKPRLRSHRSLRLKRDGSRDPRPSLRPAAAVSQRVDDEVVLPAGVRTCGAAPPSGC